MKELDRVGSVVDKLSDWVDDEIHPVVDYAIYVGLRNLGDTIANWEYESEWCDEGVLNNGRKKVERNLGQTHCMVEK